MFDNYANNQTAAPQQQSTRVVRFDKSYIGTSSGMLKFVQVLCNLVGFICIKISTSILSAIFYNLLYWVGNVVTLTLFVAYLFHLVEKFDSVPWLKFEFSYCAAMCLTYIGCSIFATTIGESVGYAVGFFGLCATIAYGLDGYLKYRSWKRRMPPQ